MMRTLIPTYLILIFFSLCLPTMGRDDAAARPGNIMLQAYNTVKEAEKLEEQGEHKAAWNKYHKALRYYKTLANTHPDWKPHLIEWRLESTQQSIDLIQPKAEAEHLENMRKVTPFIEGATPAKGNAQGGIGISQAPVFSEKQKAQLKKINEEIHQLKETNKKLSQERNNYRSELRKTRERLRKAQQGLGNDSDQIKQLSKEIQQLSEKLTQAEQAGSNKEQQYRNALAELQRERARLAAAPLKEDLDQLNQQKLRAEAERDLVAKEHKKLIYKHEHLTREHSKALQDLELTRTKLTEVTQQQEESQRLTSEVVRKLRADKKKLQAALDQSRKVIADQQLQIADLGKRLADSEAVNADLRSELAVITKERDELVEITKLDSSDQTRQFIDENVRLAAELSEAQKNMALLSQSLNASQDRTLKAETDVAVAKKRILNLQEENNNHKIRITKLENKLRGVTQELTEKLDAPDTSEAAREEAEFLKGRIKQFIAAQNRKREAAELLMLAHEAGDKDALETHVKSFINDIVTLTDRDKELLKDVEFSTTLVRPKVYAADFQRERAQKRAEDKIDTYHNVAMRFVREDRLELAKEIFDEAFDRYPYHYDTLMKRGIVRVRLNEYGEAAEIFEEGIGLRSKNPYTHFMLGSCQFRMGEDEQATKAFQAAVDLQPDYPEAYLYLGIIDAANDRFDRAAQHLQTAIRLNPDFNEAHYNLSAVFLHKGDKKSARKAYAEALRTGLPPRLDFERRINFKGNKPS